jgi:hypothetical protein
MDQLLRQGGGGSLRLCKVEGEVQLKCGDGRMLLTLLIRGAPMLLT